MDTISQTQEPTLACGCKRGFSLCPKAEQLWANIGIAYQAALDTGKWFPYHDFTARYQEHFEQ